MILISSIISIAILVFLIIYRQSLEKKKYQGAVYLSNLQQVFSFFDTIKTLNDYITWVQRDQIKSKYSIVGQFFKGKTNFYKKEESVKKFNEIFSDFDNYIITYNQNTFVLKKKSSTIILMILKVKN